MAESFGNIFEEFLVTQKTVLETNLDGNGNPIYTAEHVKLLSALGEYFKSMKWARNDKEKAIYLRTGKGLRTSEIAEALGINPNTYRSMVSTVSKRLRVLLFDGESLSSVVLSAPIERIEAVRKHIEFLSMSFDFYSQYSDYELGLIAKYSEQVSLVSEPTKEDLFLALFTLASISKKSIDFKLSSLNPLALQRVVEELTSGEYSDWKKYYQILGVGPKPKLSEASIKSLKDKVGE